MLPGMSDPPPAAPAPGPADRTPENGRARPVARGDGQPPNLAARLDRHRLMISLVIPIFNEQETIEILHRRATAALEGLKRPWQVVYVNDGSRDRSLEMLLERQEGDPRVVVVDLSRNWGHQPAITAGLSVAQGEAVVLMDGDLQDPPEAIADMVAAWEKGAQVVIAERRSRAEKGLRGMLFPLFYKALGFLSDYPIPLNAGIFGLLDRRAVDSINALGESNRYLPGLRAWVGFRTEVVYYDRAERAAGEPKQNFWKLLRYALDAIFSFSYKPLRLSLFFGLFSAGASTLYAAIMLVVRLLNINVVPGFTTVIVAVTFLGGIQLFCVGLLGEYIGRIYDEVKRRPLFLIHRVHQTESRPWTPPNTPSSTGSTETTGSTAASAPSSAIGSTGP
jgi:polyisoprenyl-phosphate glycosyltransferase